MKKLLCILLDVLTAAFLAGGWLIHSFTTKKLGMSRWVVFQSLKWKKALPLDVLKLVVPLLFLVLFAVLLKKYLDSRQKLSKPAFVRVAVCGLLLLFYVLFTVLADQKSVRAYYLLLPFLSLAVLLQLLNGFCCLQSSLPAGSSD